MAKSLNHNQLRAEMLAIVHAFDTVNAREVREMIRLRWHELGTYLDKGTILFIMGIHGSKEGKLGPRLGNIKTMQDQVNQS